jgi:acyl-CoA dehydrogenase family protein 9
MGMQIAGGNGYMKEYPYERFMRDSRINLIFEGTNEILRCLLALSGVRGPSEDMKQLGKISDVSTALNDPIKSLGVFTKFARKRLSNMMGSVNITRAHAEFKIDSEKFTGELGNFAIAVEDTLIKFGKKIVDNELPQGRLADMCMELYVQLAVMSRTTSILNNSKASDEQKDYVLKISKLILRDSRKNFERNRRMLTKNLDKSVAKVSEYVVNFGGYGLDIIDF